MRQRQKQEPEPRELPLYMRADWSQDLRSRFARGVNADLVGDALGWAALSNTPEQRYAMLMERAAADIAAAMRVKAGGQ